jgi:polypeptide N-acetylgalactosaminyltransferase
MMSKAGEIRRDETCLDYAGQDVILYPCHGSKGNQFWQYNPDVSVVTSPVKDPGCFIESAPKQTHNDSKPLTHIMQ